MKVLFPKRFLPLLPVIVAAFGVDPSAAADRAEIAMTQASEMDGNPVPRAVVGVADPGEPTLPFHVALAYSCPAGTERQELFVSIADTANLQDATAQASPRTLRIDVPLRQLQWLAEPATACDNIGDQRDPDEVDDGGTRYFRIRTGTAGYATVTCRGKSETSAATTSAPLDVWLSCPALAVGESPAPG